MTEQEFTARQQELLNELPDEFKGAVSYRAWEQSHANGYDEVLITVGELVEMLKKPIEEYTDRIRSQYDW